MTHTSVSEFDAGSASPPIADSIHIDAPPARVWALVRDVRNMARWSPQVAECTFVDDGEPGRIGARFVNHNVQGELRWPTHGEVVQVAEGREIAFRIAENFVVWVLEVEPAEGGGTILTEIRTTPEGISQRSRDLADRYLGGQGPFTELMRAGVRTTLEAIKVEAETPPA